MGRHSASEGNDELFVPLDDSTEEDLAQKLAVAKAALEADRERRVAEFLQELAALTAKYNVELRSKPVELEVIPLD